jgi:hypothetical protein
MNHEDLYLDPIVFAQVCLNAYDKLADLGQKAHPASIADKFSVIAAGVGAGYQRAIQEVYNASQEEHTHENEQDDDGRSE